MKPHEKLPELDQKHIGLDRKHITESYDRKEEDEEHDASGQDTCEPESRSSARRLVDSIKDHRHDAAVKIRQSLHIAKTSDNLLDSESPILGKGVEEKSESRLVNKLPLPEKHTLKDFLHKPVETVKSIGSNQSSQQVAAKIAEKEIPHGEEVDLVNAATAVQSADSEDERVYAIQKVSRLLDERQSTYARWTLNRHVTKVRRLPRDTFTKKSRLAFEKKSAQGDVHTDWRAYGLHLLEYHAHQYGGQYIGYGSNPSTPSKETIMPNIERLIVATSPFQELIMTTRRVYRWESTTETLKYLVIYILLCQKLTVTLSAMLYLIAEHRIHGNSIEDLRADIKRREDVQKTALSLTEFIEKKGDKEWADELLQSLGPWLMIQLADTANFFETVRNFYEWQNPHQTMLSLCLISGAIVIATFMPAWLLLKASTLSAGVAFFGLFPISIEFLDYRLLVSPVKRLLWNIPTHAEWAIKYVQEKAACVPEKHKSLFTTPTKVYDHGFYEAYHNKASGHLILSTDSVRFESNIGHTVHFMLPYSDIQALEKEDRIVAKSLPSIGTTDSGKDMKLVNIKTGGEWMLKDVRERDEAFSQVIGFSQTNWQVVW